VATTFPEPGDGAGPAIAALILITPAGGDVGAGQLTRPVLDQHYRMTSVTRA
jgi:hypothetical protein